jgi:DNA-binding transcriptional LysR family regulator
VENAALNLERVAAGRDSLATASVRVTMTDALRYQLVVHAIAVLRHAHPGLQVDPILGVRSLDIARRDADFAVRLARPASSDLVCRKLGEVGLSLYASRRYLAKSGIPKRVWDCRL